MGRVINVGHVDPGQWWFQPILASHEFELFISVLNGFRFIRHIFKLVSINYGSEPSINTLNGSNLTRRDPAPVDPRVSGGMCVFVAVGPLALARAISAIALFLPPACQKPFRSKLRFGEREREMAKEKHTTASVFNGQHFKFRVPHESRY